MFEFEANDSVIMESHKVLEAALSTNPKTQAVLRKTIRKYIMEARQQVINNIKFNNGDPRQSRQAVRTAVYKKVLGANLNILNGRQARHGSSYEPPRKVYPGMKGHRGGNRRIRSQRTQDMMTLDPKDRGFILRFVNSGTNPRYANGRNVTGNKRNLKNFFALQEEGDYYRGSIAPRNFFKNTGNRALAQMADNLSTAIEEELTKILSE